MPKATGISNWAVNFLVKRSEITTNGEPSSHQILAYAFADFLGLVCSIIPLTKSVLRALGTSITLESIKNSAK